MKTIAIYHKDCTDGTTAAAVVLKKYPGAILFPMSHGYEPEEMTPILEQAKIGDRILTVDGAFGARELLAAGHKVTSIDHHIGIKDEYTELAASDPNFTFVFDNAKSGASLTWTYLFPGEKMPELIKYVEDFDLWNWKYGDDTKDVGNRLFIFSNKPEEIGKLFEANLDALKAEGHIISKYTDHLVEKKFADTESITVLIGNLEVPFYNITEFKSSLGNLLTTARNQTVALFNIKGGEVHISFRSLEEHSPSSLDLARKLGGGGHKRAAGAMMKLEEFVKAIKF